MTVLKQKQNSHDTANDKPKNHYIKKNKMAVYNSYFIHNQTDASVQSMSMPVALQNQKKHEKSVFSHNGSMATTSLTNLTKSKMETKENTNESKEFLQSK